MITKIDVSISPNPVKDLLYVEHKINHQLKLELWNLKGELLKTYEFSENKFAIDFRNFPSSVYILQIRCSDNLRSFRIIKE